MASPDRLATVDIRSVEPADETADIDLSVTVIEPTVTTNHPAAVRITVRNIAGSPRSVRAGQGERSVFSTYESTTLHPGLVLATPHEATRARLKEEVQACWRLTRVPRTHLLSQASIVLSPEESQSLDVQVWGHPENQDNACLPMGTYHFDEQYETQPIGGEPRQFEWGFDLSVATTK